ncbi:MAG: hypothetical protein L6R37_000021 [Teloschistes peruensis]|nr:MAG: hypothetical protein L6R37_000021 [Teloschistes peruensis]
MADKYLLRVTAGPSYDPTDHQVIAVNSPTPTHVKSALCDAVINVRIQNYRGLPHGSPATSSYFSHPPHTHDQYSIGFSFVPHRDISGKSLVFGNDFEHPVRDRIPPGFSAAFKIVKWAIDPGLDGDVYADKPYLYGNALSSINALSVGPKVGKTGLDLAKIAGKKQEAEAITEGGYDGGQELRDQLSVPEFALKLPGFSLKVLGYLGGEDYLRYVLKDKDTGEVLFVVVFTLLPKEQVDKEDDAISANTTAKNFEPQADDLD